MEEMREGDGGIVCERARPPEKQDFTGALQTVSIEIGLSVHRQLGVSLGNVGTRILAEGGEGRTTEDRKDGEEEMARHKATVVLIC